MSASRETSKSAAATADREIVHTRLLDAPRELVWEAFTDPRQVAEWWGPAGFTTTVHEMDVRPGGVWRHTMHGPDGTDYPNKSVFIEVVKPERIVYSHGGGKKGGQGVSFEATWTFEAQGEKTLLTGRMVFPTAAARDLVVREYGAIEGGKQTLARLAEKLKKMQPRETAEEEFVITRTFDAPRELVWQAWTDPERLMRWWGPKGLTMLSCKVDLRPGGLFHYGMRTPDGHEMWGKFVYREIVPPERLVLVVSFSDAQGGITRHPMSSTWPLEVLNTMTLTESGGKTTLTLQSVPVNATGEERRTFKDGHRSMQQGFKGTLDQLAEYLESAKG
jgi:uncharacterized protein YndB with AHSA1/START domain